MVIELTAVASIVIAVCVMTLLYASAQANSNAYNVHAGVWTSPPAA